MIARVKVSQYFHLDEFVDPHTYFNEADHGLSRLDHRLFKIADKLRELHGKPLAINNWWSFYEANAENKNIDEIIATIESSSLSKWSGLRTQRCNVGAKNGAHYLGKAIDPKGNGPALFKLVEDNAGIFYDLGVRRLEDTSITPTWLHADTMEKNTKPNSIRVVDLKKVTKIIKIK